jgi:hypothetical protein
MYDLFATYFPEIEEITPEQMQSARARVVNYLSTHFPDVELSPGSNMGDLMVSPMAAFFAATEVSQNRFMSDLDLENVANGIIYSCDFVERYLGNFAVKDITTLQSSGLVRLTFSADQEYRINKGAKFQFGSSDLFYLRLASAATDHFRILPAGTIPNTALNEISLAQTSLTTWAVDLPLLGKMSADVARGTTGLSSATFPELIGIVAAVDFDFGLPPVSLSDLAKAARRTAYAASVGSRNGTQAFIAQQWPETKVVSVVATGDAEMQRTTPGSSSVLQAPAVDIYYRSRRDAQVETQTVRLAYVPSRRVFRGKVSFLHRPSLVTGITWAGSASLVMTETKLYSQVTGIRYPGSTGCGSAGEEFWLEVTPPADLNDVLLVPRSEDVDGMFAMFSVSYLADPLLEVVSAMLTAPENAQIGVDVLVRSGPLIALTSLTVNYRRRAGTTMTLDTARAEIATYINGVGWPELFSEAAIVESMYAAGALRTHSLVYAGRLTLTPAARRFSKTFQPLSSLYWDLPGVSLPCLDLAVVTAADMRPSQLFVGTVNDVAETYAVSDRNIRYHIDPADIVFNEIQ